MIYKDGYPMDENLRVTECPVCANEEFSDQAEYCRICGMKLYNYCEGEYDRWNNDTTYYKNPGNARYCETCGKPTYFFKEGLLETWDIAIKEVNLDESDVPF